MEAGFDPVRQLKKRLAAERLRLQLREVEEAHLELDRRAQAKERDRAQAQDQAAEQARAEADNAYRNAMNLSPGQFVEMERIKMQNSVCAKPEAKCTFIIGGDVTPVINAR